MLRPVFDALYCTFLLIRVQLPSGACHVVLFYLFVIESPASDCNTETLFAAGVIAMWSYGIISIITIKLLQPDFANLVTEQERTTAEFRTAHDRASGAAESIAFAGTAGIKLEEAMVNEAHGQVLRLQHRTNDQQAVWSVISKFIVGGRGGGGGTRGGGRGGGGGGGAAMNLQSLITQLLRFFWSTSTQGTDGEVLSRRGGTQMAATSQFIGSLISQSFGTFSTLLNLNESFQQLFGTCRRVSDVLLVIDQIEHERQADALRLASTIQPHTPRRGERLGITDATVVAPDGKQVATKLTFSVDKRVEQHPESLTPLCNGDRDLLTEFSSSSNLLVSGGSGVGKTTLVRVLSGLWSTGLQDGSINRPDPAHYKHLAVVPQQPLVPTMSLSLLDMLTYPEQLEPGSDQEAEAIETLSALMRRLEVSYIVKRSGGRVGGDSGSDSGWRAVEQWETYLSMGEFQCLGIIRALYHRPAFAILDEVVSAMPSKTAHEAYNIIVRHCCRANSPFVCL